MSAWWSPLQQTFSQWSEHKDSRLGAALLSRHGETVR